MHEKVTPKLTLILAEPNPPNKNSLTHAPRARISIGKIMSCGVVPC